MRPLWRIDMLGAFRAKSEDVTISRFRTRRVGLLLAFLAYYRDRSFSRAELADMLWPEFGGDQARINLRQALASLRRHIEPPSIPKGAVLVVEQDRISINSELVTTDTASFVTAIKQAKQMGLDWVQNLKEATDIYKGDLLPGYYEEWVLTERLRMEDLFVAALQELIEECDRAGRLEEAIPQIHAALSKDRLREDLHFALMRAYSASGSPARAVRHFNEWRTLAREELGEEPSEKLRAFAEAASKETAPKPTKPLERDQAKHARLTTGLRIREATVRLPVQLTRFFGRIQERQSVVEKLGSHGARLITLLGPAGAGKTRLSIEIGRILAEGHGWNVWFVPLADISDGARLLDTLLSVMRVSRDGQTQPLEQLRASVSGSKNLIVIDNLEHVVESAAPVIGSILAEVAGISCLTTSRQSLSLQGEQLVDLSALAMPNFDGKTVDPAKACSRDDLLTLSSAPSVQLFVDRSQGVRADFQLTTRNAHAIATICSKLDGLPLAIEIAAGLSNVFTPGQLLANLEDRLEILRSRTRDAIPRHRSLWMAISYSYELLSPELQRFFAELSVFRGGFTIDAAEHICLSGHEASKKGGRSKRCLLAVLDLQERSLLRSEEASDKSDARFRLLESFREFGREQLSQADEEALQLRHARYYFQKAAPYIVPRMRPPANYDRENWLVALDTFRQLGALHECVGLLVGLRAYSQAEHEAIMELASLPEIAALDPVDQIWLFGMQSKCWRHELNFDESLRAGQRALEIAIEYGQDDQLAICHTELSDALSFLGRREEALEHAEKTLHYGQRGGNLLAIEVGWINCGTMMWALGRLEAAIEAFEGALKVSTERTRGNPSWLILHNLARVHLDAGNCDEALEFAGEGLRMAQKDEDDHGISMCISMIALYHLLKRNLIAALATSYEALVRRQRGFLFWLYNAIQLHARILIQMGRYQEGATLLAASRMVAKFGRKGDDQDFADALALAKANLSESEFERAWAEGITMSVDEAICLASEFR